MYKVVLVDDEELIIEGMKRLVNWKELGCEIVGAAYDGDEALDIINEAEPDILITDIRMPAMDGLTMIDYVKERFPDLIIMIMSGYSDFEYAHQALEKGAACYMLKPVSEKELSERILQAVKRLDERNHQKEEKEAITVRLYRLKREARISFLYGLLNETPSEAYILEMWKGMELCPYTNRIRVAVLDTDFPLEGPEASVIKFAIDNIVEEVCRSQGNCESVPSGDGRIAVFMMESSEYPEDRILEILDQILKTVQSFSKISVSAGLSKSVLFPSQIRDAYQDALNALKKRFYESKPSKLYEGKIKTGRPPIKELRELENSLLEAVKKSDKKNAAVVLGRMFHMMLQTAVLPEEYIYNQLKRILVGYQDILFKSGNTEGIGEDMGEFWSDFMYRFKLGNELKAWMEGITVRIIECLNKEPDQEAGLIERIKYYISRNYRTATRQSVADYFFLNPSYLSQLFKAETGEVFTDYVNQIRMEEAKRMLVETDYKIQHIADLAGYASSQHFNRTFKKYTGMQPAEYKKKMQNKQDRL